MDRIVQDVIRQFSKPELVEISKDFGLEIDPRERATEIAVKCVKQLRKLTLSDDLELSDLGFEFAVAAEVIDEDGNLLEVTETEKPKIEPIPEGIKIPECYTIAAANDKDPSCQRCKILNQCKAKRIAERPSCFGTGLLDKNNEDCKACIEFIEGFCEHEYNKRMGVN